MGVNVRQKKKGRGEPWWIFIAHNGKRTSRRIGDKAAAEKVASEIRAKLQLGDFELDREEKKSLPTFNNFLFVNPPLTGFAFSRERRSSCLSGGGRIFALLKKITLPKLAAKNLSARFYHRTSILIPTTPFCTAPHE